MPDRANQAFLTFTFLGVCVGAFVLLGFGACVMLGILGYRVQRDGVSALTAGANDARPAAVFLAFVAFGALAGLWSLRRQWIATRRLTQRVHAHRLPPTRDLALAAERTGVSARVHLIDAPEPFSFTFGLLHARIAVSRGFLESVSAPELDAVLEHERYHLRHRDPLKVLVTRSLAPALFFLPALRDLRTRYVAAKELAADRRAIRCHGRRPLAGALYKVLDGPAWTELAPAAAIGGTDALDARVTQIETGHEPAPPPVSARAIALSVGGAAALLSSFLVALYAFGGPAALARLCNGSA